MIDYPDICEGCLTYEEIYKQSCNFAYVRYDKDVLICPCSICLVKMVCIDACPLLKEHRNKIREISYDCNK
jgi:hypothetical protein